jgi:hypothetical protein
MSLENYLRQGVTLIYASRGTMGRVEGVILYDESSELSMRSNNELTVALAKRFKRKKARYGEIHLSSLFYWVLASSGYDVNEGNVDGISNDDVLCVWELADTMKVSSSDDCRAVLTLISGARGSDGFRRAHMKGRSPPSIRDKSMRVPSTRPKMLRLDTDVASSHKGMEDVMAEDIYHFISGRPDPKWRRRLRID